jgi:hypothetical protein
VEADLEAQGVARCQAGGRRAAAGQLVPQRRRVAGVAQHLDAVLARVAGAADERRAPGQRAPRGGEARGQRRIGHRLDDLAGPRALDGEHRVLLVSVRHLGVGELAGVRLEPGEVLVVVGGVGDRHEAVGRDAIGEEVVQHAAVVAAQDGVLSSADGDLRDVVGQQALQQVLGLQAAGLDLAHVRDVEQPAGGANGDVLLADPGVLHGHLPPREGHELRARVDVAVEQGRALEGLRRGGGGHRAGH